MFKFLRKYNKLILAIGGVLLMIIFLIPQAITRMSQEAGRGQAVYATVDNGVKVTAGDMDRVRSELMVLDRLPPELVPKVAQNITPEHWYLLTREAEQAGLVGTADSIKLPSNVRNPKVIRGTLAKLLGVNQMLNLFQAGELYSDRRLQRKASHLLHLVDAEIVAIQGQKDFEYQPTDDEMLAQMNKYADTVPGEGEDGFGYKLPDRVKLEWISIPVDSVRKSVEASDALSQVQQRLHWKKNEGRTFPPADGAQPIPEMVRNDLLQKLTKQKMDEIARDAADQLRLNRRNLPEKDGYVVLPADWPGRKLQLQKLAEYLRDKYKIDLPSYQSTGEQWKSIADLRNLEGVGKATTDKFGPTPIALPELVAGAKELSKSNPMAPIQQDVAGPPLRDSNDNLYIFRVTAVDQSRKPNSIDEVRDQVVADLKRMAHYKQLEQSASAIESEAETKGLLALAMAHHAPIEQTQVYITHQYVAKMAMEKGFQVTPTPSELPVVGPNRKAIDAILNYAMSHGVITTFKNLPESERVFTVPVPEKQTLLVVRLLSQNPLTHEDYVELIEKGGMRSLLASEEEKKDDRSVESAFGYEALAKRHNFRSVYGDRGDKEKVNGDSKIADAG
jgi:hypothetical protein